MAGPSGSVYRDQPSFKRGDPLTRWSISLLIIGIVAMAWSVLLFFLMAGERGTSVRDQWWTLSQTTWVVLMTIVLIVTVIGLIFVIIGRLGATEGGSYLSADLDAEDDDGLDGDTGTDADAVAAGAADADDEPAPRPIATTRKSPRAAPLLRGARIDNPFGPDGNMLLSYTIPRENTPGVYGDARIAVDSDVILNVRTRLAQLKNKEAA